MKNDLNTIWNVKCSYRAIMANGEICSMTFNCTRLCGTECHYKQEGELKTEKENYWTWLRVQERVKKEQVIEM